MKPLKIVFLISIMFFLYCPREEKNKDTELISSKDADLKDYEFKGPIAKYGLPEGGMSEKKCDPEDPYYSNNCIPPMDVIVPLIVDHYDYVAVAEIDYDPNFIIEYGGLPESLPEEVKEFIDSSFNYIGCEFGATRLTPIQIIRIKEEIVNKMKGKKITDFYYHGVCNELGQCSVDPWLHGFPFTIVSAGMVLLKGNRCCAGEFYKVSKGGVFVNVISAYPIEGDFIYGPDGKPYNWNEIKKSLNPDLSKKKEFETSTCNGKDEILQKLKLKYKEEIK